MTKPTSSRSLAVVLSVLALGACGSDPYVGSTTATDTGTPTSPDTNTATKTATNSNTSSASNTQTTSQTRTDTVTSSGTAPVTITVTTTMTMTSVVGGQPDAGIDTAPPDPNQADIQISVAPNRLLDLVVMVDNSPSMAPKVAKLNAQFPKLIAALKDPNDGYLPDLRVAVIDSDLGTGNAYSNGSCGPKTLSDGTVSIYGDLGRFQMLNAPTACTFNAGDLFLEYKAGQPLNYTGDINTVFACLAGNLGSLGCGEEHQLQAFEFALVVKGLGNETQQNAFLRGNAYLGLVFLTDEDDCSAAMNDGMFGSKSELYGESASLRCSTRGHMCGGQNLADINPPSYPTTGGYTHPFSDCQARKDECALGTDTTVPTSCTPLHGVNTMANEIKGLKADPDNQIFVAGIFGWPLSDTDMASATYKIAPVPNPNIADTQHPTVFDYWPVCYDPNHKPTNPDPTTGFDSAAAGWGATGGLRESAFIDEFGANGQKFSICQPDFSGAMSTIGNALAKKLQKLCVDQKLYDSDLATAGLQPDCRVVYRVPQIDPSDPTKVIYVEGPASLPKCDASYSLTNPPPDKVGDCWQLTNDTTRCPINGQLVTVVRTAAAVAAGPLAPGTKIGMQCRVCPAGSTDPACTY